MVGTHPPSLPEPSSHSPICLGLFLFFTQAVCQHLGVLLTLGVMDKEGVSLLAPTFAPASKRPHFLLHISVTV